MYAFSRNLVRLLNKLHIHTCSKFYKRWNVKMYENIADLLQYLNSIQDMIQVHPQKKRTTAGTWKRHPKRKGKNGPDNWCHPAVSWPFRATSDTVHKEANSQQGLSQLRWVLFLDICTYGKLNKRPLESYINMESKFQIPGISILSIHLNRNFPLEIPVLLFLQPYHVGQLKILMEKRTHDFIQVGVGVGP